MCRVRRDAHAATSLLRSRKPARKRFSKSRFVPSVSIVIGGRVFQKRSGLSKSAENFKSLASTSSATSAPLFLIGFSPRGNECFPGQRSRFPKRCKTCSLCVPHPSEGPDDVRLRLDVPGVVLAHALRLVAQQV